MRKRDALKLHNGDEVLLKKCGTSLIVLDRWLHNSNPTQVVIEGCTQPGNLYLQVFHTEVK